VKNRTPYEGIIKIACSTCPRAIKYRGYSTRSQNDADDEAVNEALRVGWVLQGFEVYCPACVRAGRIPEEGVDGDAS